MTIKAETGEDRDKYVHAMQAADQYDISKLEMPLVTIEVTGNGNNQILIDDYKTWFENYR